MRVAHRAPRAASISVDALVRLPGREHVLPDRVARARVVERRLAARSAGSRAPSGTPSSPRRSSPASSARPPRRSPRSPRSGCRRSPPGRGCPRGRGRSGRGRAARSRRAGRRSPPGRRGTRPPRPTRSSTSPSTASKAGRLPWTSESRAMRIGGLLQCRGNGAFAAAALRVVVAVARRRCGDLPASAAQRRDRARPSRRPTVLHGLSARPRGGLPQRPAAARAGRARLGIGTLALLAWRPPRRLLDAARARGRSSAARPRARGSRLCWLSRGCR